MTIDLKDLQKAYAWQLLNEESHDALIQLAYDHIFVNVESDYCSEEDLLEAVGSQEAYDTLVSEAKAAKDAQRLA